MISPLVTVFVPSFNRADTIEDLIKSYMLQDFNDSELLIIDDCVEDYSVSIVVNSYVKRDPRIRFIKNKTNLGFAGNVRKGLAEAKGRYILMLGDDDVFASSSAVGRYVSHFEQNSDVAFIYSNIVQCDISLNIDFSFQISALPKLFDPGLSSLENAWLMSCYIPGIGLRNESSLIDLYPKEDCLFPQVELVGRILLKSSAMLTGEYLFAGRAHPNQLGFKSLKRKVNPNNERHSVVELPTIAKRIACYAKREFDMDLEASLTRTVNSFFRRSHATIFPTEKANCGNRQILHTFFTAVQNDMTALTDIRFISYFLISFILPSRILLPMKEFRKRQIYNRQHATRRDDCNQFLAALREWPPATKDLDTRS